MKYQIVTDVTNDLTPEELAKLNIIAIPGHITVDAGDLDVSDVDAFYQKLVDGVYPPGCIHTSSASAAAAFSAFERAVNETDSDTTIVYASTSEHISSGTLASHRLALAECIDKYPNRNFVFAPTYCTSNGQALCLQYLAEYDGDDMMTYAATTGKHIVHLFTEREFNYSLHSGRYESKAIKRAANFLEAVKFSPWMYFPSDGELQIDFSKIMRGDVVLRRWVKYYVNHRIQPADATSELDQVIRIGYAHKQELPRVQRFISMIQDETGLPDRYFQVAHIGPFVGAHTGPTCVSIFFRQDEER